MNCRINYTQSWALRLLYELSSSDSASFVTLTYSDENLPKDMGLHKEDLQNFFKRLRINMKRKYHEFTPKLRYYACGEYGSKTKRCHYHAIIFNLDYSNDEHREILRKSWQFCEPWFFDKNRGRASAMQEVTPDDIAYVTGYVQKKLSGELAKEEYGDKFPPFSLCSQGLGLEFCLKNKDRLIANGYTFFKGHRIGLPKYFADKLEIKRSTYLSTLPLKASQREDISELFNKFRDDMIKNHTWYPENLKMMERRFVQWYERGEFSFANCIYKDFIQRQKLRSQL